MSILFTPAKIGPIELKNRAIRASAFEGMAYNHAPSSDLTDYHVKVAKGGAAMTCVAYAAINRTGVSFFSQLWMREEIVPGLKKMTDAIHEAGSLACIQLGHCGNMSHRRYCGTLPVGPSSGFNMYSPTFVHGLSKEEIAQTVKDFGNAVRLAKLGGFDAVEIHCGHGYLISQFLSPFTNHRHDEYGGSLENRMRFMTEVMKEVMAAAGEDLAVMCKVNTRDGFKGGMEIEEAIEVAKRLEKLGTHCLVLSGGFVSKAPMYVMRGAMPVHVLTDYMPWKRYWWLRIGMELCGKAMCKSFPYKEAFFYDDAIQFRKALKMPLAFVGGLNSRKTIDRVLDSGFEFVEFARALVRDTEFINKLKEGKIECSDCEHSNYCVASIWNLKMDCHKNCQVSRRIERELQANIQYAARTEKEAEK